MNQAQALVHSSVQGFTISQSQDLCCSHFAVQIFSEMKKCDHTAG